MKAALGAVPSSGFRSGAVSADVYKFTIRIPMPYLIPRGSFPDPANQSSGGFYTISGEPEISAGKASPEMRDDLVSALNTGVDAFDNHIRSSDILAWKISGEIGI